MNHTTPALDRALDELKLLNITHRRIMLRRAAEDYERNPTDLYYWTFPPSRSAVFRVVHQPDDHAATKALCKAIYADLILARELPSFYQRRAARVSVLRELLACECMTYARQKRLRLAAE